MALRYSSAWSLKNKSTLKSTLLRVREVLEDVRKKNVMYSFRECKEEDLGDYRPVSFSSVCGEVIEQILLEVISRHMEEKNVNYIYMIYMS